MSKSDITFDFYNCSGWFADQFGRDGWAIERSHHSHQEPFTEEDWEYMHESPLSFFIKLLI